uniref:translocation and assembly module lipoprotein TamL n=1 Tax=Psychroflexus aestuariivivens TaxID=1795040 RepID=UPI002938E5E0|nr:BamA/TamA family outer membrane protein [Psychroflexus aestuariivivens]
MKKYVPDGEFIYDGAEVEIEQKEGESDKDMEEVVSEALSRNVNTKFFGMYPGLYFHYKSQREKPGFINKFFNKQIGEEPLYFSDVEVESAEKIINNRLENNGFFNGRIQSEILADSTKRNVEVNYKINLPEPYRMASFKLEKTETDTLKFYNDLAEALQGSEIKADMQFDLDFFKSERERIDKYLKRRGYYNFNSDFLIFETDTNQYDQKKYDLYLRLKNEVPQRAFSPYVIDEVNIYPNRGLEDDKSGRDTTNFEGMNFIQDPMFFKPKRLKPYVLIESGDFYDSQKSRFTSRRLASMQTYKFVNIEYSETDTVADKNGHRHLKTDIYLSPLNKRALLLELQAVTKSNNFAGPNLSLTYSNRNLFKGGELLSISANAGYEQQFFGQTGDRGLSSIQLGLKTSITFPRLIFPVDLNESFKYAIPKTKVSLGIDFLRRSQLYTLNSVSTSFGYIWEGNSYVTHQLRPINVEYVNLSNTSSEFEQILDENPFLRRSFEQQFIAGLVYSFTYNEIKDQQTSEGIYFSSNYDMAGNGLDLFSNSNSNEPKRFLGLEYAHYVKADIDFRYHLKLDDKEQKLIGRIFAGVGQPLGDTESLPFVKQYFAGGPYSVRAFRIRSLGPGTYSPEDGSNSFFDQAGDMRLEANIEYRFPIFSFLKGAVFADAGNVWLMNENSALPGGKFSSDFMNELGIGPGLGLRIDIQGFVIRFDLAAPLKRPAQKWDFEVNNTILNFAIGYPF